MKTLFCGDISPTTLTNPLFEKGDINALFSDVSDIFKGNDVNFINLECALTESEVQIKKMGGALKAAPKTAQTLKKLGVNYVGLSNNHIFDFGIRGSNDTIDALENADIEYTGFGNNYEDSRKNLVIEKNGEKIAIIAVCEHEYTYALDDRMGARPFDEFDTIDDIREAKKESDRVIVIYHGGKEHCQYPSPRLVRACRAMARNGADMVLCQHSHCLGCYEQYEGCHILYGQGNFHFVKKKSIPVAENWNGSLAVGYDTKSGDIDFIPIVNTDTGITIAKGEEKETLLNSFYARNEKMKNGEWQKGWSDFCESVKEHYCYMIRNACNEDSTDTNRELFAHFLDCEAHTDVWRELFKTYNQTNEK